MIIDRNEIPKKVYAEFFRDELKRVYLGIDKEGKMYTETYWLDKDTLTTIKTGLKVFSISTVKFIFTTYLHHVTKNMIHTDWVK